MTRRLSLLVFAETLGNAGRWLRAAAPVEFARRQLAGRQEGANAAYRLFAPLDAREAHKPLPLVIYLHGAGAKGSDDAKPSREPLAQYFASAEVQAKFPCYVLVPQCRAGNLADGRPHNWVGWRNQATAKPPEWRDADRRPGAQLKAAMAALRQTLEGENVDRRRVYLTGVSMGGSGTWYWPSLEPSRFAAAVPVCGLSEPARAPAIGKLPVWTFQGETDDTVPVQRTRAMVEALRGMGAPVRYSEFAGVGHGVEPKVRAAEDLLPWLFAQARK